MHAAPLQLAGSFAVPATPVGAVILVFRTRSERERERNVLLADLLHHRGFATLLVQLLTPAEAALDAHTGHVVADVERMAGRVALALDWVRGEKRTRSLPIGLVGEGHAAPAVLLATAHRQGDVAAVVGRGGHPDAIGEQALASVRAPALLIVGEGEQTAIESARSAAGFLEGPAELAIVKDVSDPTTDTRAYDTVCWLIREWLLRYVPRPLDGA